MMPPFREEQKAARQKEEVQRGSGDPDRRGGVAAGLGLVWWQKGGESQGLPCRAQARAPEEVVASRLTGFSRPKEGPALLLEVAGRAPSLLDRKALSRRRRAG